MHEASKSEVRPAELADARPTRRHADGASSEPIPLRRGQQILVSLTGELGVDGRRVVHRGLDHRTDAATGLFRASHLAEAGLHEAEERVGQQSRGHASEQPGPVRLLSELPQRAVDPDRLRRVVLEGGLQQ